MRARDIMTRTPVTVTPDHGVRHAAEIMLENAISGLPVTDDRGRLVGVISEGDLMRRSELLAPGLLEAGEPAEERLARYVKSRSWRVGDVMTRDVITVEEGAPLGHLAALMDEHGIKRLFVVSEGRLVGVVSRRDLMRAIVAIRPERGAAGDEAIARSVQTRIGEVLGTSATGVTVAVADGIVSLSGMVHSKVEKHAARVAAESVAGVCGIEDRLAVSGGGDRDPEDEIDEIRTDHRA